MKEHDKRNSSQINDSSGISFRDFLIICCDMEMQKPFEKIDTDFVDKCVDILLKIQGIDATLSDEELAERINHLIGKNTL